MKEQNMKERKLKIQSNFDYQLLGSCYRTLPRATWDVFSEFLIFVTYFMSFKTSGIIAKYEKRRIYLPILQEVTYNNYFIVKQLLKSKTFSYLLTISSCLIQCNTNSVQTSRSKHCKVRTFPIHISKHQPFLY